VREVREFRVHHEAFRREGIALAGVSRDTPAVNRKWSERLEVPYPMLSDPDGAVGRALGIVMQIGIGTWHLELFRRTTFLIDPQGIVSAAWGKVRVRGHATEVLSVAKVARTLT